MARRPFDCPFTGELCNSGGCTRDRCGLELAQAKARRKEAEDDAAREFNLLAREAEKVAREWLPGLAKRSKQKVTPFNRQATLNKLARHPKVIEEAKRRREAAKKSVVRASPSIMRRRPT